MTEGRQGRLKGQSCKYEHDTMTYAYPTVIMKNIILKIN